MKRIYKSGTLKEREREQKKFVLQTTNVPFPKNALIEISSLCNHACVFCNNPRMLRKGGELDKGVFRDFCAQAKEMGLSELGFYTTGEPFVLKSLKDYVAIAHDAGIQYLYITTNGALATLEQVKELIDSGLNSIKYSVNAGKRETYKLIHGKDDFDRVVKNIRDVRKYIDENNIQLRMMSSFIVTAGTECDVEDYKNIMTGLVDDYKIVGVTAQVGYSVDQFNLLKSSYSLEYPKFDDASPCFMLWNRVHLTQEGYLTLCCVDYENNLVYSDLKRETLGEAWNNVVVAEMRKNI